MRRCLTSISTIVRWGRVSRDRLSRQKKRKRLAARSHARTNKDPDDIARSSVNAQYTTYANDFWQRVGRVAELVAKRQKLARANAAT